MESRGPPGRFGSGYQRCGLVPGSRSQFLSWAVWRRFRPSCRSGRRLVQDRRTSAGGSLAAGAAVLPPAPGRALVRSRQLTRWASPRRRDLRGERWRRLKLPSTVKGRLQAPGEHIDELTILRRRPNRSANGAQKAIQRAPWMTCTRSSFALGSGELCAHLRWLDELARGAAIARTPDVGKMHDVGTTGCTRGPRVLRC
jgi:hypothetical protein